MSEIIIGDYSKSLPATFSTSLLSLTDPYNTRKNLIQKKKKKKRTLYNMLHTLFFPKLVRWFTNPHWIKIKIFMFARPFSDLTATWLSIVSFVPVLLICVLLTLAFFIPQMCHAVLDFKIKHILFSLPRIFSPVPPASSIRHLPSKFYPCFTAGLKFHDPMEVWFLTLDWDRPPFNQLT